MNVHFLIYHFLRASTESDVNQFHFDESKAAEGMAKILNSQMYLEVISKNCDNKKVVSYGKTLADLAKVDDGQATKTIIALNGLHRLKKMLERESETEVGVKVGGKARQSNFGFRMTSAPASTHSSVTESLCQPSSIADCEYQKLAMKMIGAKPLTWSIYNNCMAIILGETAFRGESDIVESFGKKIRDPFILPSVMCALKHSSNELQCSILKDVNVLLINKKCEAENGMTFATVGKRVWATHITSTLFKIPKDLARRSETENTSVTYAFNVFYNILMYSFRTTSERWASRSDDESERDTMGPANNGFYIPLRDEFNHVIDLVSDAAAWVPETVNFVRNIFVGVINKVARERIKSWKRDFKAGEWYALFDLVETIQDFMFYRPSRNLSKPVDEKLQTIITAAPPGFLSQGAFSRKRGRFGLHIVGNEAEDLDLASRVVKLFKTLGVKGSDENPPEDDFSPIEIQTWNKAVGHAKTFDLFSTLFNLITHDGIGSEKAKNMLEKIGEILESKKHECSIGNLFGAFHVVKHKWMQTLNKENTLTGRLQRQLDKTRQHATIIAQEKAEAFYKEKCFVVPMIIAPCPHSLPTTLNATHEKPSVRPSKLKLNSAEFGGSSFRMFRAASGSATKEINLIDGQPERTVKRRVSNANEIQALNDSLITTDDNYVPVTCARCSELIDGGIPEAVCAVEQYWHRNCFNCCECSINLMNTQNGEFFVHNGEPYCRRDFVSKFNPSLCTYCLHPAENSVLRIGERIWHAEHFFCSECNELIPQGDEYRPHSEEPFCMACHLKYITCALCNLVCLDGYLRTMNRSWHAKCLRCMHCATPCVKVGENGTSEGFHALRLADATAHGRKNYGPALRLLPEGWTATREKEVEIFISPEGERSIEFPSGDILDTPIQTYDGEMPFCTSCFYIFFFDFCQVCNLPLDDNSLSRDEGYLHDRCVTCLYCSRNITMNENYMTADDGGTVCMECYELKADRCPGCSEIIDSVYCPLNGDMWHESCLSCAVCAAPYDPNQEDPFRVGDDGKVYCCLEHYTSTLSKVCSGCSKHIIEGNEISYENQIWHEECFVCNKCGISLPDDFHHQYVDEGTGQEDTGEETNSGSEVVRKILLFCRKDYLVLISPKCFGCKEVANPAEEPCAQILGNPWHLRCLVCSNCNCKIQGTRKGKLLCQDCLKLYLMESA